VQRVSNRAIERTIAGDAAPAAIMASSHNVEGHAFAVFSGADWTRVFDAATQFWHSRESFRLGRWRARFPVKAWGKTIVGDELTGNLYFLDKDSFVEGDQPLVWGVDTPVFTCSPRRRDRCAAYRCGDRRRPDHGSRAAPKLMLSWSTDGGATFKGHRELPARPRRRTGAK
jgi:hypothetical protein